MILKRFSILLIVLSAIATGCTQSNTSSENQTPKQVSEDIYANLKFEMQPIQEPAIPAYSVSITDFGAIGGGKVLNTKAFADAIDAVSEKGGGKVVIPPGIWLTGPIILKSNLELHACKGAIILFSTKKDLYPIIETNFEGLDTYRCLSPVYGKNLENIAFTGEGVWDGNGDAWRMVKKSKLTASQWKKIVASGGIIDKKGTKWYPSEQFKKGAEGSGDQNVRDDLKTKKDFETIHDYLRPVFISIQNCKHVMFDGPVFQNSPAWNIHPLWCEDLIVRNISVRNPWYSQNGDGIDIESCKNVLVENCSFDVGDDAICIKSGKNEDGRRHGIPCENLIIRNNIVYHGHGGVTVGSEMSGGVKNMHVENCTFMGTDVGLRFKSTRGRGGVVENIYIKGVQMTNIPTFAISFNLYYGGRSASEMMEQGGVKGSAELLPVTEETPQFKNIEISDITVKGARQAVLLQGLPEMNLENVKLDNMYFDVDKGFTIIDAKNVKISNIKITSPKDQIIEMLNCKNIEIKGFDHDFKSRNSVKINGEGSKNISVKGKSESLEKFITIGDEVDKKEIKF